MDDFVCEQCMVQVDRLIETADEFSLCHECFHTDTKQCVDCKLTFLCHDHIIQCDECGIFVCDDCQTTVQDMQVCGECFDVLF